MIDISEIKDRDSLQSWLTDWSRENRLDEDAAQAAAVTVAHRAAMRELPLCWARTSKVRALRVGLPELSVLRCCLTSGVAGERLTPEIRLAAHFAVVRYTGATPFTAASRAALAAANVVDAAFAGAASSAASAVGAAFSAAETIDASGFLTCIQNDCRALSEGGDVFATPLWHDQAPPYARQWQEVKAQATGPEWAFWIKWYDDALAGRTPDWTLLEQIALIDNAVWEAGPQAIAREIEKLRAVRPESSNLELDARLRAMSPAPQATVAGVRQAMERNRRELPPTYEAIESLILLELERQQKRNDRDDAKYQIRIYVTLYEAIVQMRQAVPAAGAVTEPQAAQTEKLWRLYSRKMADLPRQKADEVVQGIWETGTGAVQFGLIGWSAYVAALLGLPVNAGVAVGALCFAPKKAGTIIKSAKDLLSKGGGAA